MSDILQMFSGNPLSTFIGKKIEAATRPELESDDWALNLEICDMINENDDDARDAVRAIKKRLQQTEIDRDFTITSRTLTVLETCVSNCSRRFHVLVMTKDFMQDLVKLIGPKNNPPIDLQERVLRLIERWAEAFRSQPDLGGVFAVYQDLKAKGVTFPPKDPNSNVPIQTPQRTVLPQPASPSSIRSNTMGGHQEQLQQQQQQPQAQPAGPIVLEGEGYGKISQDLEVVQTSVEMFNDIMRHLETDNEDSDWKLAADLNSTCRQMKDRIVDLIERVANEDLTIELLRLNDDLNNIFIKYDRLVKNRSKSSQLMAGASSNPAAVGSSVAGLSAASPQGSTEKTRTENELSLIDFNADSNSSGGDRIQPKGQPEAPATSASVKTSSATAAVVDPFNTSAINEAFNKSSNRPSSSQERTAAAFDPLAENLNRLNLDSTKKTSGLPEEISSVREQDFAEIENWLSTDSGRDLSSIAADLPSIEPVSLQNTDFENFIANRALAGSSAAPATTNSRGSIGGQPTNRKPEPST